MPLFARRFGGCSPIFALTRAASRLDSITSHSRLLCLLFALLPIVVRLAILPWRPVPYPRNHDEFVHLLGAATFAEGRLANAPLAFREHLESIYVLQEPTYSSIYPPGIAASLALGQAFTGYYWAGVLLTTGLMCALSYWALRAWSPPPWAALGGALIMLRYGIFSFWPSAYSGGSLAACGGALTFGALGRFWKQPSASAVAITAAGLSLVLFTRPFEGLVFSAATGVLLLLRDRRIRFLWPILPIAAAIVCFTAIHNHAVTGSATRFPYQRRSARWAYLSNLLPLPAVPEPAGLAAQQKAMYAWQRGAHDRGRSLEGFVYATSEKALRFGSAYVGLPLTLALGVLLFGRWTREIQIAVALLAVTLASHTLYPFYVTLYSAHVVVIVTYLAISALAHVSHFPGTARCWFACCWEPTSPDEPGRFRRAIRKKGPLRGKTSSANCSQNPARTSCSSATRLHTIFSMSGSITVLRRVRAASCGCARWTRKAMPL